MKYKGIIKERKPIVTYGIFLAACVLTYLEIARGQWIYLPLCALVILACFFRKEQIVDEKGFDIEYTIFHKFNMHNYWTWEEITTLHTDHSKARPNVMLHIGRDVMTRTYVMDTKSCQGVLAMAAEKNPKIYIDESR